MAVPSQCQLCPSGPQTKDGRVRGTGVWLRHHKVLKTEEGDREESDVKVEAESEQ